MPNRLAHESSPYLLQHQNNPVDWHPWGPEAIERSRREQKPIFLSIGYSACHWCHVMEHESFENEAIAELLNRDFVPVKVDREERPDLDQIYMNAVQAMTGRGGWPMSVFLTPELEPFFGGTYWPPHAGRGMPGFDQILAAVADAWKNRRAEAVQQAGELTRHLKETSLTPRSQGPLSEGLLESAATALGRSYDHVHGGFGAAPKFPHSMDLQLLLRVWRRHGNSGVLDMVRHSLDHMAAGGIYDHLGGGFARYSVDERWLVPHFEKMLYDNALLAGTYLDAYLATGDESYARVVRETLDYLLRDMTDPQGGFYSTEDADSEGEEGKFYVWTPDEIGEVLGDAAARTFCYVYDVTEQGNFEERNILNLPKSLLQNAKLLGRDLVELETELAESRKKLLAARNQRVRPGRDDKVIVSWNGLAIDAFARAGAALAEPRYTQAAAAAAAFLLKEVARPDEDKRRGRLLHTWRQGAAKLDAYLDDYAALAGALVSLYEATFDERWIDQSLRLVDIMLQKFSDPEGEGFYYTASDHEQLIARTKDVYDNATPSGNALAAGALVRLAKLTGRKDLMNAAEATLRLGLAVMERAPSAAGTWLAALDMFLGPTYELALVADPASSPELFHELHRHYLPNKVVACRRNPAEGTQALAPLFAGKTAIAGEPTLYICRDFACQAPVTGATAIRSAIAEL